MSLFNGKVNVDYLDEAARFFSLVKRKSYDKMEVVQADSILDAGCGPGIDAIEMGSIVTHEGNVFGIDCNMEMLYQANERTTDLGMGSFIKFLQCDVSHMPFESNYFDSCRAERVFMHLHNPQQALTEIHRVTKPGGKVVVVETDWGSLSIDCNKHETERILAKYRNEKILNNGYSGRSLYRLFKQHKFSDIDIKIFPLYTHDLSVFYSLSVQETIENQALADKTISAQELEEWRSDLKQAAEDDSFFCCVNVLMVSGSKTNDNHSL